MAATQPRAAARRVSRSIAASPGSITNFQSFRDEDERVCFGQHR